jgi:hypothetical protein
MRGEHPKPVETFLRVGFHRIKSYLLLHTTSGRASMPTLFPLQPGIHIFDSELFDSFSFPLKRAIVETSQITYRCVAPEGFDGPVLVFSIFFLDYKSSGNADRQTYRCCTKWLRRRPDIGQSANHMFNWSGLSSRAFLTTSSGSSG